VRLLPIPIRAMTTLPSKVLKAATVLAVLLIGATGLFISALSAVAVATRLPFITFDAAPLVSEVNTLSLLAILAIGCVVAYACHRVVRRHLQLESVSELLPQFSAIASAATERQRLLVRSAYWALIVVWIPLTVFVGSKTPFPFAPARIALFVLLSIFLASGATAYINDRARPKAFVVFSACSVLFLAYYVLECYAHVTRGDNYYWWWPLWSAGFVTVSWFGVKYRCIFAR
jgi:hypothetical protein